MGMMASSAAGHLGSSVSEDTLLREQGLLAGLPGPTRDERAQRLLRTNAHRMRTLVIDDDATGSQTVHDVALLFSPEFQDVLRALDKPGAAAFVLTNARSVDAREAAKRSFEVASMVPLLEERLGGPVRLISRSDSTLRGHFAAEIEALRDARRRGGGRDYDCIIFAPGYFEAGRVTIAAMHRALVQGAYVPVGETEFARDPDFEYRSSDLRQFVAERLSSAPDAGGWSAGIRSVGLGLIRRGGVKEVEEALLCDAVPSGFAVVDGTCYADYEVVASAASELERKGRAFLYRTGPSFVTAVLGQEPPEALGKIELPSGGSRGGLVVVGSHVRLTNLQLAHVQSHHRLRVVEVDARLVVDPATRDRHVAEVQDRVNEALDGGDVLLVTSRTLVRRIGDGLGVARCISDALVRIVSALVDRPPRWLVAKGGITSHDLAERALGIRSAVVTGQLERGAISLVVPQESRGKTPGMAYVIFAGNVGAEDSLTRTIKALNGEEE